jgi:hypothetical protein
MYLSCLNFEISSVEIYLTMVVIYIVDLLIKVLNFRTHFLHAQAGHLGLSIPRNLLCKINLMAANSLELFVHLFHFKGKLIQYMRCDLIFGKPNCSSPFNVTLCWWSAPSQQNGLG